MNIPLVIRCAALCASVVITSAIVQLIADYALPESSAHGQVALAASAGTPR